MSRTTFELECILRMEIARTERYQGTENKQSRKEYARKMWVLETLYDYIHEHREENPYTVLEDLMNIFEQWHMESTHEEAKDAFLMAHDYAENLYDCLFGV